MSACIRCHCGQRVGPGDVLEEARHVRVLGPSFVYLRFRCPRCRRLGERFVEQAEWDAAPAAGTDLSLGERRRFAALGPITADEAIDFHFALEDPGALRALAVESGHAPRES